MIIASSTVLFTSAILSAKVMAGITVAPIIKRQEPTRRKKILIILAVISAVISATVLLYAWLGAPQAVDDINEARTLMQAIIKEQKK